MSFPHGTHIGGIRTIEDLRLRCRVDDCTGCWHWSLAMSQGSPRVHFKAPDTGKMAVGRGRRVALYLARGADLPAGHIAFAKMDCVNPDCVNPDHARSGTKRQHGEIVRRTEAWCGSLARRLASAKGWKGRKKVTPEVEARIHASDDNTAALARELGLAWDTVNSVRMSALARPVLRGSSVFAWGSS